MDAYKALEERHDIRKTKVTVRCRECGHEWVVTIRPDDWEEFSEIPECLDCKYGKTRKEQDIARTL